MHACAGTKHKGIDDDSRYCGADHEPENHVDGEAWREGHGDSEHRLNSEGEQEAETPTIPDAETRRGHESAL